jgi:hypothetical protein
VEEPITVGPRKGNAGPQLEVANRSMITVIKLFGLFLVEIELNKVKNNKNLYIDSIITRR